jgi:hypothetical protein
MGKPIRVQVPAWAPAHSRQHRRRLRPRSRAAFSCATVMGGAAVEPILPFRHLVSAGRLSAADSGHARRLTSIRQHTHAHEGRPARDHRSLSTQRVEMAVKFASRLRRAAPDVPDHRSRDRVRRSQLASATMPRIAWAVSSAGQSASLTPRRSGVRAPHRPLVQLSGGAPLPRSAAGRRRSAPREPKATQVDASLGILEGQRASPRSKPMAFDEQSPRRGCDGNLVVPGSPQVGSEGRYCMCGRSRHSGGMVVWVPSCSKQFTTCTCVMRSVRMTTRATSARKKA